MSEKKSGMRYSRTEISATCLLIYKGRSYMMNVHNISASGILLDSLENNAHLKLKVESQCVLEIVVNDTFNFNVEAEVIRFNDNMIALRYTKIPENKQAGLWKLLGEHVHLVERFEY